MGRNFQNALVLVKIEESNCCGVVNKWNLEQKNLGPRTGDGRNFRPENDQQINDWRRVRDHEKKMVLGHKIELTQTECFEWRPIV